MGILRGFANLKTFWLAGNVQFTRPHYHASSPLLIYTLVCCVLGVPASVNRRLTGDSQAGMKVRCFSLFIHTHS